MASAAPNLPRSGPLPIQMRKLSVNPMSLLPQQASVDQMDAPNSSVSLQSMRPADFATTRAPYRCANSACTESVGEEVWRRECGMCGETFCYACTSDVRKVSAMGQPDQLGKEKRVCAKCVNLSWEDGNIIDHKDSFQKYRSKRPKVAPPPPPQEVVTPTLVEEKRSLAVIAAERLTRGYQVNCSAVKGLMAEFVVPSWQKPDGWQSERDAKVCEACKGPLQAKKFRQKSKVHCRLCGKIFCVDCTRSEILLYISEEGRAKWAINGREGGPTSKPTHFELLSMCDPCCKELESAILEEMLEDIDDSLTTKALDIVDTLKLNQKQLMSLVQRIEQLLWEYRKLADCVCKGVIESIGVNPVHMLAKLQCHLNGTLAQLSIETRKLQLLKPSTKAQGRLLKNIALFFNSFYVDNMYSYRQYQGMVSTQISNDALQSLQAMVCKVSMGDVHRELNVIMFNGLELKEKYHFSDTILMPLVAVLQVCEDELKALDPSFFESHCQAVKSSLQEDAKNNPLFGIFTQRKARNYVMASAMICHIAASGLKDVLKMLMEKTVENECLRTKKALKNAVDEMESSENVFRQIITSTQVSNPASAAAATDKSVSDSELTNATPHMSAFKPDQLGNGDIVSDTRPSKTSVPRSNTVTSVPAKSTSKAEVKVIKPTNASTTTSKTP